MNASYASPSSSSLGRKRDEESHKGEHRNPFSIDRDRILYSKAFFRLAGKTQVFMSPQSPLVSNRMTHTMHVAHLARSISRSLGLNEDLAEAIGLGHSELMMGSLNYRLALLVMAAIMVLGLLIYRRIPDPEPPR